MPNRDQVQELKFQLRGWILFLVCAFLFLASSLRARDAFNIAGSAVFVVSCFYFMIPLVKSLLAGDGLDGTAGESELPETETR